MHAKSSTGQKKEMTLIDWAINMGYLEATAENLCSRILRIESDVSQNAFHIK